MGAESVLMSVISMLNDPNIESPANLDASLMFRDLRDDYNKKVRVMAAKTLDDIWAKSLGYFSSKVEEARIGRILVNHNLPTHLEVILFKQWIN